MRFVPCAQVLVMFHHQSSFSVETCSLIPLETQQITALILCIQLQERIEMSVLYFPQIIKCIKPIIKQMSL